MNAEMMGGEAKKFRVIKRKIAFVADKTLEMKPETSVTVLMHNIFASKLELFSTH